MNDGKIRCEHSLYYTKLSNCDISLCKNAVIRNWYGKHLRANEKKIFLKISFHGDTRSWNVIPVFSNQKRKCKKNQFSKNSVEQPLQSLMLTKFGLSLPNNLRKYWHVVLLQLDKRLIALHLMHDVVVKN